MKNDKLFKSPRWNENVGAVSIGHKEFTKEEKEKNKIEFDKILIEKGIKDK